MISDAEKKSLVVGLKQVKKALQANKVNKIFIANDCSTALKTSIEELCKNVDISPIYIESMTQLGRECGIDVKASCACICK